MGFVEGAVLTAGWQELMRRSILTAEELAARFPVDADEVRPVISSFPMRINPYFLDLVRKKGLSLFRQVVPDPLELTDPDGMADPLAEDENSPVPNVTHRYPDRVLFLVSSECPVYCRFCTRKRKIGGGGEVGFKTLEEGIRYIRSRSEVRDVLLSGGDPLLLSDDRLEWILSSVRSIPHVDIIRIGTRVPGALPQRITPRLCAMLRKYHPLYMNLHFNHPDEITDESVQACGRLADAGIPLGSQTVLLRGINDDPPTIRTLMQRLLSMRIRPYYLLQGDLTFGTAHFRTPVRMGLDIIRSMRGSVSGLAIPAFVVDLPGGGGKVPMVPDYFRRMEGREAVFSNYLNREYRYPEPVVQ
jgi:lysine 2,3-aminomutase